MNSRYIKACSIAEYRYYESERVIEDDLSIGGLYTAMFALQKSHPTYEALKATCRIADIDQHDSGLYEIRFNILNADLVPNARELSGASRDGYIRGRLSAAAMGYFREHDDGMTNQVVDEVATISNQLSAVSPVLEPVAA